MNFVPFVQGSIRIRGMAVHVYLSTPYECIRQIARSSSLAPFFSESLSYTASNPVCLLVLNGMIKKMAGHEIVDPWHIWAILQNGGRVNESLMN